jgi:taurine dioxygenase
MGTSPGARVLTPALYEDELADFSARLGSLEHTVRTDWASPAPSEITLISNLKDAQARPIGGLGDGELQWHSDHSYMLQPATGAMLYARAAAAGRDDLLGKLDTVSAGTTIERIKDGSCKQR